MTLDQKPYVSRYSDKPLGNGASRAERDRRVVLIFAAALLAAALLGVLAGLLT